MRCLMHRKQLPVLCLAQVETALGCACIQSSLCMVANPSNLSTGETMLVIIFSKPCLICKIILGPSLPLWKIMTLPNICTEMSEVGLFLHFTPSKIHI